MTRSVNETLTEAMRGVGIELIDFKLEFGRERGDGAAGARRLLLADEISADTCRFWDLETGERLDKDRFRRDLGKVEEAYQEIAGRLNGGAGGVGESHGRNVAGGRHG
jgi:phosphoribosylaminoimidazole-succinocarboxamide synthase